MAFIRINKLHSADSELFQDSESFLNDLSDADTISVNGGGSDNKLDYAISAKKIEACYLLNVIGAIVDIGSKYSKDGLFSKLL